MSSLKSNYSIVEGVFASYVAGALGFWASHLVITTLFFIVKFPLSAVSFLTSGIFAWIFIVFFASRVTRNYVPVIVVSTFLLLATFVFSVFISAQIIDISFDGQAYHQEAVVQLSRGWNPIYMMLNGQATANLERWLNHYPKGIWYVAGNLYQLTGNIETGKALSIFTPMVAFAAVCWGIWRTKIKWFLKLALALVFVLNPVVLYQSLSYYADGVLVSLLLVFAFVGVRIITTKEKPAFFLFLFALVILINIKLSSVVFAGISALALTMYLWLSDRLRLSIAMAKVVAIGFFVGMLVVGFNPYVTNFVTRGHPLYPAMGRDALDYLPTNTPENYWNLIPPARLLHSIFSYSSLARGQGQYARLKPPFLVAGDELLAFHETNAKTGGFGPLFGGIFLATIFGSLGYVLIGEAPSKRKYILAGVLTIIVGSAGVIATSSVARYVPYVWWAPAILALFYFMERKTLPAALGLILVGAMLINSGIVSYSYFPHSVSQSGKVKEKLTELAGASGPLVIDVAQFGSTKLKLQQYGIEFTEVPRGTACKSRKRILPNNITEACEL